MSSPKRKKECFRKSLSPKLVILYQVDNLSICRKPTPGPLISNNKYCTLSSTNFLNRIGSKYKAGHIWWLLGNVCVYIYIIFSFIGIYNIGNRQKPIYPPPPLFKRERQRAGANLTLPVFYLILCNIYNIMSF